MKGWIQGTDKCCELWNNVDLSGNYLKRKRNMTKNKNKNQKLRLWQVLTFINNSQRGLMLIGVKILTMHSLGWFGSMSNLYSVYSPNVGNYWLSKNQIK